MNELTMCGQLQNLEIGHSMYVGTYNVTRIPEGYLYETQTVRSVMGDRGAQMAADMNVGTVTFVPSRECNCDKKHGVS
jgi:hypothetical protein